MSDGNIDTLLTDIYTALGKYLGLDGTATVQAAEQEPEAAPAPAKKSVGKKKAAAKPQSAYDARKAKLEGTNIVALRQMALDLAFEDEDVKDADKGDLVEAILGEEFDEEGNPIQAEDEAEEPEEEEAEEEAEEEGDEEEEEGDGEAFSRDELEGMSLRDLKSIAKDAGYEASELKGLDQDGVIDLLVEEGEAEAEDEDEAEDEEEEESEEAEAEAEEEEDVYTEDDLNAMDTKELRALAKEWEIKVPAGSKKADIIDLLLGE